MKKFSIFFVLLLAGCITVSINAQVHWDTQTAPGFSVTPNPFSVFSAVDQNICWGIASYDVGFGVTNPKMVLTTDGGETWNVTSVQLSFNFGVEAIYARDAQTAWIAVYDINNGSNSGIYKTINGGASWTQQPTGYVGGGHPTMIYFYNKSDTGICIGTPRNSRFEVYTTVNGGSSWNPVSGSNIPTVDSGDLFPTGSSGSGNTFIFGTYLRKIYKSTNRGVTWTKINNYPAPGGAGVAVQLGDSFNGIAGTYFGDHVNRMTQTTDGGSNWTQMQPTYPLEMPSLYYLSYVPGTSGWYVVTSNNNVSLPEVTTPGSAYTLDGGETWNLIDTKPHGPASFSDDGWGWSGGIGDTIYRISRDVLPVELTSFSSLVTGNNIQLIWQTATEINNKGFEVYRNGYKIAFVNGKGTTTESQDYSFVDKNLNSGIYNYRLNQIDFNGTQKVVGELTVLLELPEKFSLEQNFPNPFNPSTSIKYSIPNSEFVTLKVFDVLGKEVATLVNEEKPAGSYKVEFKAADIPSGVYFYRMQTQNFSTTKKMILLR